jgi:sugar O-acyltransferase (sialic acid O-acetyltransferase NeuD family)
MSKIIIYGRGTLAKLVCYYIQKYSNDQVVAYTADSSYCNIDRIDNIPLIPFESVSTRFPPKSYKMIVAIGYSSMRNRKVLYQRAKAEGYHLSSFVSPDALVDDSVVLGDNTIIFSGVVIEPFCKLGNNNLIWSGAVICHETKILDHCFAAANSTIGGKNYIEDNCFIGFNASVLQQLTVSTETLLGAGAVLTQSTSPYTKYLGIPASAAGTHEKDGIVM